MHLIREMEEDVKFITEASEDGKSKSVYITGPFLQGNVGNINKRFYSVELLENEVNNYKINKIDKGRAYGELGHPDKPTINLPLVSHMIKSLHREGTTFIGKAKVCDDTPNGKIVKGLIAEGANLGVSSRGVGSLKLNTKTGLNEVQSDFKLNTAADIVADPSGPDCFVQGIMEGAEWIYEEGIYKLIDLETAKRKIQHTNRSDLTEAKLDIFEQFTRTLSFNK